MWVPLVPTRTAGRLGGSPELPVPAHGHHHQQVPQDGHQDHGRDEGEQHDLLRDAEGLTRTGEHTQETRKEAASKAGVSHRLLAGYQGGGG